MDRTPAEIGAHISELTDIELGEAFS
jgi:hypothetical protein